MSAQVRQVVAPKPSPAGIFSASFVVIISFSESKMSSPTTVPSPPFIAQQAPQTRPKRTHKQLKEDHKKSTIESVFSTPITKEDARTVEELKVLCEVDKDKWRFARALGASLQFGTISLADYFVVTGVNPENAKFVSGKDIRDPPNIQASPLADMAAETASPENSSK